MKFESLNENPSQWLRLYLGIRSWNRSYRQIFLLGIPLLLIVIWISLAFLFLSVRFGYIEGVGTTASIFSRPIFWLLFLLPLFTLILVVVKILPATAQTFVSELYRPSSETESEIKERIWHRLWGWHGFFSFQNYVVVKDTKLEPTNVWSSWLGGPAFLIINDGFAAYLERGNCFSRVVGAGFPMPYLSARETIKAIVDLRPQIREANASAWTKDGIKVKIRIRVEFQIQSSFPSESSDAKLMYPFDPLAVRKAVEYSAVRMRDGKLQESDWRDGVKGKTTGLLAHHIASRHLDELFIGNKGDGQMLSPQVMNALLGNANTSLTRDVGVHIISIQITDVSIPSGVRRQQMDVWEAEKDSLIARIQGESQADQLRTIELVRAKAQRNLIVAIAKSLGRVDPSHFTEPLLLSLSGILDQGLKDPLVQTYMAKGTLDALKKLQDMLRME